MVKTNKTFSLDHDIYVKFQQSATENDSYISEHIEKAMIHYMEMLEDKKRGINGTI